MKDILRNIALFTLVDYCKENKIDCAGSHLEYAGRYKFRLVSDESGQPLASVQYSKHSCPLIVGHR